MNKARSVTYTRRERHDLGLIVLDHNQGRKEAVKAIYAPLADTGKYKRAELRRLRALRGVGPVRAIAK